MLIKEIIDMTKEKPIAAIVKDHLLIGEKKLREVLKNIGGQHKSGQKGWTFEGDPGDLEKSIYDFTKPTKKAKAPTKEQPNNVSRETINEKTNPRMNKPSKNALVLILTSRFSKK